MRRSGLPNTRAAPIAGLPGPIWPPTRLPGCVAWYDMLETFTDGGGTVTAVRNMVSGSDDMAEATNPPALDLLGINGRPCMAPDGVDDRLVTTEATVVSAFSGSTLDFTVQAVVGDVTGGTILCPCRGDQNTSWRFAVFTLPDGWRIQAGSGAATTPSASRDVPPEPHVVTFIVRPERSATIMINAERLLTDMVTFSYGTTNTQQRLSLCGRIDQTPDTFSATKLGAVVVWDHALSLDQARGSAAALMGRWRIST